MKAYTWHRGQLEAGLELCEVERFGLAVVLGDRGRGRWQEIITLDRCSPPAVTNGRVLDCEARTIAIPARDGRPERKFVVLTAANPSSSSAIVRVWSQSPHRGTVLLNRTIRFSSESKVLSASLRQPLYLTRASAPPQVG